MSAISPAQKSTTETIPATDFANDLINHLLAEDARIRSSMRPYANQSTPSPAIFAGTRPGDRIRV
jgi:hypothetical protein